MSEQIISPGVFQRENDQSFLQTKIPTAGAALMGPTPLGVVGVPTICTTYSDYLNRFGSSFLSGSNQFTYFTSIAAYNYFQNGGDTLLVTRITPGGFSSATSSLVSASSSADNVFTIETLTEGEVANSTSPESSGGSLSSGSKENLRWEVSQRDETKGTFTLLVRRGNDITNEKSILETWTNLNLDPQTPNFISKVIGDTSQNVQIDADGTTYLQTSGSYTNISRYIRIKSVNVLTPNYLDNAGSAKTEFTGSIPKLSSGSFGAGVGDMFSIGACNFYQNITDGGATADNTQGLKAADYTQSLSLLANKDEYKYNSIIAPGLVYSSTSTGHNQTINTLINNSQTRGDNLAVIDSAFYNTEPGSVVANSTALNSSYAATYWPWLQTVDPDTGQLVWVPASTMIPSIFAFNDSVSEPWFAPAGLNRGALNSVVRAERKLPQTTRDTLYDGNVNPIATFPNTGVVVYGQKTLQLKSSALDRVNVRRLLIALKNFIGDISQFIVFEQNTISTRNQFLSQVNPYLESVQQRQGLFAFKVVMDDSNNTPDVIDRNQLVGQIFIQPTKTAEFIILDYNILPTGATFPS
jgi:uncharacterized protein